MSWALPIIEHIARRQAPDGAEGDVGSIENTTAPTDFTPDISSYELWNEKSYLDGVFVGSVAYGVHATLFFITLGLLWKRQRSSWRDYIWIVYVLVLFTMSSIGNAAQMKFAQMIWIDNRDYPGGPSVYFVEGSTATIAVAGNIVYILNTWLQDGLLLYRFWIIFGKRVWTIILPGLIFLASVSLAIVLSVMLSQPTMTIWSTLAFPIFTSYWCISIGFNVLLTIAIVGRLLVMRSKIGKAIAGPYASISAMLIESASMYSICGVIFIVSYAVASPVQNLVLPTLAQIQSISPLLIIMRVAQGQAWTTETMARMRQSTNFGFSSGSRSGGRTAQSDTYAMSNPGYDQKGSYPGNFTRSTGGISTRVETVTWQDDGVIEHKRQDVV